MNMFKSLVAGVAGLALAAVAHAAPITAGNLVIYRVGDGAAALSGAAAAVTLDEYTPTGSLVQSIPLTSSGAGALTATGNSTTEGIVSVAQDGNSLVFTGYRIDAGTATGVTAANKVIGTVGLSGVPNLSVAVTDVGTSATRSATTVDGSSFYLASAGAVRYVAAPGAASTSTSIDPRNSRQVNLYGNTLYASNGSTAVTAKVQSYGTLPTGTTTPTPVVTLTTADAVNGFVAVDVNPAVAGVDTLYALSTVEGLLRKYTSDGTNWTAAGSIGAAAMQDLIGVVNGTDVNLYLTSPSGLFAFTDATGIGGSLTGTIGSAIAAPSTNTAFRGIGVLAVPEPTSLAAVGLGAMALLRRRRGSR